MTRENTQAVDRQTILVVEDEEAIAAAVVTRLDAEGFRAIHVADGPAAVEAAVEHRPDLIVLDLNLPGFDGLEVCRRVHGVRPVPVVMLTARSDETDLLVGLGIGADDYLTKPFSMKELTARVRAVLRRSAGSGAEPPADGEVMIDAARRLVEFRGDAVHLTPTEFDLLRALHEANGAVLSRLQLLDKVWGYRDGSGARTVDSHIRSIRRKMSADLIRTVHGVGYSLHLPDNPNPDTPDNPENPANPANPELGVKVVPPGTTFTPSSDGGGGSGGGVGGRGRGGGAS